MKVTLKTIEYFLPKNTEDGSVLKKDNPEWRINDIENKTGIFTRYISGAEQTATDLAVLATEKLFENGVSKKDIGFLVFVTQSPDYALPTSACILQSRLGLHESVMAFDVNLGCSGFVYGLAIGGSLIESGFAKMGLLVCADTYTKYIDKHDRTCRPIFSDGASSSLLTWGEGIITGTFEFGTDGSGARNLIVPESGARREVNKEQNKNLFMNGAEIFMFTMEMVPKCVNALLNKSNKTIDNIDLFVFHQASKTVMDSIIRRLKLPEDKVYVNYNKIGNTVSASIPIAIKDAVDEGRLKTGDCLMIVGFGVGYSWGGCILDLNGEI